MNEDKKVKIRITFFDESELVWIAPTEDRKLAIGMIKGARWLEETPNTPDSEYYNTDYIFKWKILNAKET